MRHNNGAGYDFGFTDKGVMIGLKLPLRTKSGSGNDNVLITDVTIVHLVGSTGDQIFPTLTADNDRQVVIVRNDRSGVNVNFTASGGNSNGINFLTPGQVGVVQGDFATGKWHKLFLN